MLIRFDFKDTENTFEDSHGAIKSAPVFFPAEMWKLIFSYSSPKQLANVSLVDKKWNGVAKTFPRLTNIQAAFFNDKKKILNKRLKKLFETIIHCPLHTEQEVSIFKDHIGKTKKLIKEGVVDINSTDIPILPFLIHYYIENMIRTKLFVLSDLHSIKANCFRDFILFLLEMGIDINQCVSLRFLMEQKAINVRQPFSGYDISDLEGKTAIEYADFRAPKYPGMQALLNEYIKFNLKNKV